MKSSNEKLICRRHQFAPTELQLAIENGDNIECHCYELPTPPSWIRFENFLRSTLNIEEFKVTYKDEERDDVNVSSDGEFYELLNVYNKINNNVLLIRVTPINTDFPKRKKEIAVEAIDADGFPTHPNYIPFGNENFSQNVTLSDRLNSCEKLDSSVNKALKVELIEDDGVTKQSSVDLSSFVRVVEADVFPLNIENEQMGCRPKDPTNPPEWFLNYMDKFKCDITLEITKKVMHRMQKLMARNGSPISKPEDNKDAESGDKQTKPVSNIVHLGVVCDNCEQNINGIRYRCGNCIQFDLCEICEDLTGVHDPQHVFIKMRYPVKFGSHQYGRKHGKSGPLLKHLVYQYDDVVSDINADKINRSTSSGDAPGLDFTLHWREKKLLKRLERHAQKLEKYREKHRQRFLDRNLCENTARKIVVTPKDDNVASSEDSGIVDKKSSYFNPFWTDLLNAKFLCDLTVPDGTVMSPGSHFTKCWRLSNSGEVQWPVDTVLKLMNATGDKDGLKHDVNEVSVPALLPGTDGVVSVDFIAPFQPGKYVSVWRLYVHNQFFGHKIWCSIVVERKSSIAIPMPDVQLDQKKTEKMQQEPENGEKEQVPDILKAGLDETATIKMNKWANFQDKAANNEFTGLMVPRCASITATPNNTPLDLTPPKSPEIPEEHESIFDNSEGNVDTTKQENDADMSFLSDDSEHGGSVLSLSSTDSDFDYVVVPLPPCFNYPFNETNSKHSSNNNDDTEISNMPTTPSGKEENSSVTAASDSDEENANDKQSNLNFEKMTSPFQSSFPETLSDHAAVASHIAVLAATAAVNHATAAVNHAIPLPPPPPPPPLPPTIDGREQRSEASNSPPDVCPQTVIPILPEQLMSAAATVFNSARGLITSIADKKVNATEQPDVCQSAMAQLAEMGFYDLELNTRLLAKHGNDMSRVIADLLETVDNDWHSNRH